MKDRAVAHIEDRTARLTILVDPRKKAVFEELCAAEDVTPSQVVRRLMRAYIEQRLGRPWTPEAAGETKRVGEGRAGDGKAPARRRTRS